MKTIFDLPAHPLFIHAPIVLIPLMTLVALTIGFVPKWRKSYSPLLAVSMLVTAIATFLATQSGDAFNDALDGIGNIAERHKELADQTQIMTFVFFALTAAMAAWTRWPRFDDAARNTMVGHVLGGLSVLIGILATIWIVKTGHEGSTIVWKDSI